MAMCFAHTIVSDIFNKHNYPCVITSLNDSKHGVNSLHTSDRAFDCRSKHISTLELKKTILAEIKAALTADFDVVFEDEGGDNEHYHIEYDVK